MKKALGVIGIILVIISALLLEITAAGSLYLDTLTLGKNFSEYAHPLWNLMFIDACSIVIMLFSMAVVLVASCFGIVKVYHSLLK